MATETEIDLREVIARSVIRRGHFDIMDIARSIINAGYTKGTFSAEMLIAMKSDLMTAHSNIEAIVDRITDVLTGPPTPKE